MTIIVCDVGHLWYRARERFSGEGCSGERLSSRALSLYVRDVLRPRRTKSDSAQPIASATHHYNNYWEGHDPDVVVTSDNCQ
jgi:hypothetical protein